MNAADRLLQRWRFWVAAPWVPDGARVLDIGCHRGEFFRSEGARLGTSVGIDPLAPDIDAGSWKLVPIEFSRNLPFDESSFDCILMLAFVEHLREPEYLAQECRRLLANEGRVVLSIPSPIVDHALPWLIRLGILDGMEVDQHSGITATQILNLFTSADFAVEHLRRFQLGVNNLIVFRY